MSIIYDEIAEKYGEPDYKNFPILGYSYSTLAKIDAEKEARRTPTFTEEIAYEITMMLSTLDDSPLDHGYYVFTLLQFGKPVHIGVSAGGSKRAIKEAKKRYGDGAIVLLAYSLTRIQAENVRRGVKRRLQR